MFIVNRKINRKFNTFDEALECAVKSFLNHYENNEDYILKRTPKGWIVKAKNPRKYNNVTYSNVQFIQEI